MDKSMFLDENLDKWTRDDLETFLNTLAGRFNLSAVFKKNIVHVEIEKFSRDDEPQHWMGFKKVGKNYLKSKGLLNMVKEATSVGSGVKMDNGNDVSNDDEDYVLKLHLWGPNYGECARYMTGIFAAYYAQYSKELGPFSDRKLRIFSYFLLNLIVFWIMVRILIPIISIWTLAIAFILLIPMFLFVKNWLKWRKKVRQKVEILGREAGFTYEDGEISYFISLTGKYYNFLIGGNLFLGAIVVLVGILLILGKTS